jgi:hypothetical protein
MRSRKIADGTYLRWTINPQPGAGTRPPGFQTISMVGLHYIGSTPKDRPPNAVRCNPVHDVTSYAATSPGIWIAHLTSVFPLHAAQSFGR